jgi:hypothetical protein
MTAMKHDQWLSWLERLCCLGVYRGYIWRERMSIEYTICPKLEDDVDNVYIGFINKVDGRNVCSILMVI